MVKTIVGLMGSSAAKGAAALATTSQVASFLGVCKAHQVSELDTARAYNKGRSEELLGELSEEVKRGLLISTKAPAFTPGSLTYNEIIDNCNKSLRALQTNSVDIYYLHGPDSATPLEEQCRAIGQLHSEGKFTRFGISNLNEETVTRICDICTRKGIVLPSVYQGGYNALHRKAEVTLIPLLRKYGIDYYAWGPLAGGALAKDINDLLHPKEGSRYQAMPMFGTMFLKDEMVSALKTITAKCQGKGLTLLEASLRWLKHHSALGSNDGFIVGASSNAQLEASLTGSQAGPLDEELVRAFEDMWEEVKGVAPAYA